MVASRWNPAVAYRLTQPFRIETLERPVALERPGDVLVRPRMTGVCGSDLKLYAGTRDRAALSRKLPLVLLHEGVGDVVETHPGGGIRPGTRVAVVPNIPCYVAFPERYPSKAEGCAACRPGGVGENYCLEHLYLSSNTDGMAQSVFRHPGSLVVPVPAEVPDRVAALAEPLTTVLAGCEKAPIFPDRRYLILGNGPIGQMVAITLIGFYQVPPEAIVMTGHGWESRSAVAALVGAVLDAEDATAFAGLRGAIDVAFECVGGSANGETLAQAVAALRPGGCAVLFGPSERAVAIDTREVIGKGLVFLGCNRSFVSHFEQVLDRMRDPRIQRMLGDVIASEPVPVRSADDLNRAFYQAWTNGDGRKTLLVWPGLE
ncbi:MAG: alcohol dehydrogenase catalytic domain-containing protein [Deltaproteobacteria bacterium]|nr:alcohol dehydrogenase catalytic domain-containing protein [Deltaproteobacteria bacterium]